MKKKTQQDCLKIADRNFNSRLMIGSGKYKSAEDMNLAIENTGTEVLTIAMRRIDFSKKSDFNANVLDFIENEKIFLLPNTSGAYTAEDAIRMAKLSASAGLPKWIKLEVHPDKRYLLPDPVETLKAAEALVKENFTVLPYINADPVLAKRLEEVGTATVMPLGSPIGSSRGLKTKELIGIIIEQAKIPVIVDAGLGAPSHACTAMEMGADGVLINTALAESNDIAKTSLAFKLAVEAGRLAYLANGNNTKHNTEKISSATSPVEKIFT